MQLIQEAMQLKRIGKIQLNISGCSAVGSALALGARCRRFKSCHSDQKQGLVSQRSSPIFVFVQIPVFDVCYANQILFRLWRMLHSDHFLVLYAQKSSHFRKILTVFFVQFVYRVALFKIGFSSLKTSPRSMPPIWCAFRAVLLCLHW